MRHIGILLLTVALALPAIATEPNPSKRQRELIEQLMRATNIDTGALMDAMFEELHNIFLRQAEAAGNPEQMAEATELFDGLRKRAAKFDFNSLIAEGYIRIYAKHFSEAELEDLIEFYSTATGRKSIEVMPALMREGMQLGAQEVGPKIEELMAEVKKDLEKKRPWRRTMTDMRWVASALQAYAVDNDEIYPRGDYASLEKILVPEYLSEFPKADVWGHAYSYTVSPDGTQFRLVSAGADSIFEWDSRRLDTSAATGESFETRYRERLEDDIIFGNGYFVQAPEQAKPE